jgi:hypothetical protein
MFIFYGRAYMFGTSAYIYSHRAFGQTGTGEPIPTVQRMPFPIIFRRS